MPRITIDCPDELLLSLGTSVDQLQREARFALAAKWFEQGKLSSGLAARIAGMERVSFLMSLHLAGVPIIDMDEAEFEYEKRYARKED